MRRVVIVGGGWSGVQCARALLERFADVEVVLLEAEAILGGRTRSIPISEGRALDLGAHYFGPTQRRIHTIARRLAGPELYAHPPIYGRDPAFRTYLDGSWRVTRKSTSFMQVQGLPKRLPPSQGLAMLQSLANYYALESRVDVERPWASPDAERLDALSVADFIAQQEGPNWIREMWGLGALDIISVWPRDISLLYWLWYNRANGGFLTTANDFTGGPQEFSVACGMGGLLLRYVAETRALFPRFVAKPDTRVRSIVHTKDGVHVDGLDADAVVVAVTPAVAGNIAYMPDVSQARQLVHAQKTGHAAKVCAVYRTAFWRESMPIMGYTAGAFATGIEWGLDTTQPDGPPSFTCFVSDQLLDRPGEREANVRAALVELMDDARAADPLQLVVWDWRDVPTVGGGPNTCFAPNVLSRVGSVFGRPESERLFFAAAEYATEFPGYVEGAIASGTSTARQVAERLSGNESLGSQRTSSRRLAPVFRVGAAVADRARRAFARLGW